MMLLDWRYVDKKLIILIFVQYCTNINNEPNRIILYKGRNGKI
jgi:hypothetical protein